MTLDSCGFAGVLLGETSVSSALCALKIAVFVIFGVFARLDIIDLFTNLYVRDARVYLEGMIGRPAGIEWDSEQWDESSGAVRK